MKCKRLEKYLVETDRINVKTTELSRLIGRKWFLSAEKLSEQSGVPISVVCKASKGEKIAPKQEKRLRLFLERL